MSYVKTLRVLEGTGGVAYRADVTWQLLLSLQMYQDAESKQVLLEWMKERQEIRSVHCYACLWALGGSQICTEPIW